MPFKQQRQIAPLRHPSDPVSNRPFFDRMVGEHLFVTHVATTRVDGSPQIAYLGPQLMLKANTASHSSTAPSTGAGRIRRTSTIASPTATTTTAVPRCPWSAFVSPL